MDEKTRAHRAADRGCRARTHGQRRWQGQVGSVQTVLVEGESTRNPGWISGKTDRGHMVNFPGNIDETGRMTEVKITSAGRNTLRGSAV